MNGARIQELRKQLCIKVVILCRTMAESLPVREFWDRTPRESESSEFEESRLINSNSVI